VSPSAAPSSAEFSTECVAQCSPQPSPVPLLVPLLAVSELTHTEASLALNECRLVPNSSFY
jgi:hypothetical protein